MRIEEARYFDAILPEHQGNPFIEALPQKKSWEELMDAFSNYPDLASDISAHPDPLVREEYLCRLKELRQPLPIYHDCFRAIERALKQGYSAKNPFTPTTAQYLHYPVSERPSIEPKTGYFSPKAETITLVGESGTGKTSMLEQLLNYFPQVIEHSSYKGQMVEANKQVVWVKVDCPHNSSVRDLCEELLSQLDLAIGREKTKPASTIGGLVAQIEQHIKYSFLGILVIDEMQRLKFKLTGGENNLLNFLHGLINNLGVPIFFCANPPFNETLAKTLKAARRAESGGYFTMKLLGRHSNEWDAFIHELWDLQWTNVVNKLTPELKDKIYDLSVGNLDMAHRIYREAQRLVIGSGDERITVATLDAASTIACTLSSSTEEIKLVKLEKALPRRAGRTTSSVEKSESNIKSSHAGDITKPQHPEFSQQLKEIMTAIDLHSRIQDPDACQQAIESDDAMRYLREKGLILDDPLSMLSG